MDSILSSSGNLNLFANDKFYEAYVAGLSNAIYAGHIDNVDIQSSVHIPMSDYTHIYVSGISVLNSGLSAPTYISFIYSKTIPILYYPIAVNSYITIAKSNYGYNCDVIWNSISAAVLLVPLKL